MARQWRHADEGLIEMNEATAQAPIDKSLPNRWIVLVLLLGIAIFNQADRFLLAGLIEPVKAEFAVSDAVMGLLTGPAFAIFYSLLAIPIAIYADRANRLKIIVAGCVVWSVFTILSGFATGPWSLAAARVGVGVGEAAFQAPAYSIIAAYFVAESRGKAFAIMALAVYFGQTLGLAGGPAIAEAYGWRAAFQIYGVLGLVLILISWIVIHEPPRSEAPPERQPFVPLAKRLIKLASYRNMMIGMALGVLSGLAFGSWGKTLFERSYEMGTADAGAAFGLAFAIPGMLGALLFGALSDRLTKTSYGRTLLLSAIGLTGATIAVIAAIWAPTLSNAILIAIPAGLLGGGWAVGIYAGLQYILPDHLRATGTAIAMLAVNLLGYAVGPWLVGQLSVQFGEGTLGLQQALTVVVPIGLVGAFLLWRGSRKLQEDRDTLAAKEANS
jgi:predicted MFS family arabinose efflux permease